MLHLWESGQRRDASRLRHKEGKSIWFYTDNETVKQEANSTVQEASHGGGGGFIRRHSCEGII